MIKINRFRSLLVILMAAASAGNAELIKITLADGGSECGSEAVKSVLKAHGPARP